MSDPLNFISPLPARKDFRIGILGAGFIVNDCHLVAYRKAGFNPVAVASRTRASAEKVAQRHGIGKVYENYEQLLDDPSIEVLDIAVPPNAQLDLIKAACLRKNVKGILAQKPLGINYAEAVEAVRICEAAGITLAVNQNMRYDPSVRAAKTLLENGTIGEPVFASIDMRAIPHWMPWQKELGWVTLRIMSIHHLDCFRYWFGDPEGIYCSVRNDPRTSFPHSDGICTYILEYKNGVRCVGIDDVWAGPAKEGCPADNRIQWRIEGLNGLAMGDIGWCKEPFTTPSTIRYASKGDKTFHEPKFEQSWFPDAFIGTMAQLLIASETGKEPAISGKDNLKTMALVEAAYQSSAYGRAISLEEVESGVHILPKSVGATETAISGKGGFVKDFFLNLFTPTKGTSYFSEERLNFTPHAQQILTIARREADRFGQRFVDTDHLLLSIIKHADGVARNTLCKQGVDLEKMRILLEECIDLVPQKIIGNIPYAPEAMRALSIAANEAKALNCPLVSTEHILLGLLRERKCVAAKVLKHFGVDLEKTRLAILREIDPNLGGR